MIGNWGFEIRKSRAEHKGGGTGGPPVFFTVFVPRMRCRGSA